MALPSSLASDQVKALFLLGRSRPLASVRRDVYISIFPPLPFRN